jgi:hypothetical protein
MEPICLGCKNKEQKLLNREAQIGELVRALQTILIAANTVLQGNSSYSERDVLLAIAAEAARY